MTRLAALHGQLLNHETDLVAYLRDAKRIANFTERPDYLEEVKQNVLAQIEERLSDNPLDHRLLRNKAELLHESHTRHGRTEDLAEARTAWEKAMVFGESSDPLWRLGALLAIADKDPWDFAVQQVFLENAIFYSGQNVGQIIENVYALHNAREAALARLAVGNDNLNPDPARVLDDIKCPFLRAAKVASALCRTMSPPNSICDPDKPLFAPVPTVLEEGRNGSCPAVWDASLSNLRYEAVPFEKISLPW